MGPRPGGAATQGPYRAKKRIPPHKPTKFYKSNPKTPKVTPKPLFGWLRPGGQLYGASIIEPVEDLQNFDSRAGFGPFDAFEGLVGAFTFHLTGGNVQI